MPKACPKIRKFKTNSSHFPVNFGICLMRSARFGHINLLIQGEYVGSRLRWFIPNPVGQPRRHNIAIFKCKSLQVFDQIHGLSCTKPPYISYIHHLDRPYCFSYFCPKKEEKQRLSGRRGTVAHSILILATIHGMRLEKLFIFCICLN